MASTTIAAEVTSALRELGTGVETQGRALRSSVRHLVSVGVGSSSRSRIAREIHVPPVQVLGWVASALDSAASILGPESMEPYPGKGRVPGDFVVVDRSLTQC